MIHVPADWRLVLPSVPCVLPLLPSTETYCMVPILGTRPSGRTSHSHFQSVSLATHVTSTVSAKCPESVSFAQGHIDSVRLTWVYLL